MTLNRYHQPKFQVKLILLQFLLTFILHSTKLSHATPSSEVPIYHVPSFTVEELQSGTQDDHLKHILTTTGLLTIRMQVQKSSTSSTSSLLSSLCKCQSKYFTQIPNSDSRLLADGHTTRSTIATANQGLVSPLSLPKDDIQKYCGNNNDNGDNVYDSLELIRDYVSFASKEVFIQALDRLIQNEITITTDSTKTKSNYDIHQEQPILQQTLQKKKILLSTLNDKKQYFTIQSIIENANHLEHFHLYSKEEETKKDDDVESMYTTYNTLDWHTDGGLFLAFIPGTSCHNTRNHDDDDDENNNYNDNDSFRIMKKDIHTHIEREMRVVFPQPRSSNSNNDTNDTNEIIVAIMMGTGAEHWLHTPTSLKLRATRHAVKMKGGDVRAWYGMSKFFVLFCMKQIVLYIFLMLFFFF